VVSHQLEHGDDFAVEPCTRSAAPDWYFAAGTTVEGSQHYLALFNPTATTPSSTSTSHRHRGQQPDGLQAMVVPRRSRITVAVQDSVPRQERIAARVHARVGRVVVERTQIFDGTAPASGPTRQGIAVSLGARSPAEAWRVPSGTTENGGSASLALANFATTDASVEVHVVLVGDQSLAPQTVAVPSGGVTAIDVTTRDAARYGIRGHRHRPRRRRPSRADRAEMTASWASTSTTGVASALGTTVTARRWVIPQPAVDADAFLTVSERERHPVTAAILPASFVDRRSGCDQ